ncbi:MAG: hypothetical protein ACOCRX_07125 [Candidatus Woesearchaeota archaeon]
MLSNKQKSLINELKKILQDINEEAINDDKFNDWLSNNYFFKDNLEEVLLRLRDVENTLR